MKLTQFSLQLDESITIKGEYEGNAETGNVVIFTHGFGVKRDSWGMFNELGDLLKKDCLVVRFDFVEIIESENTTKVFAIHKQAKMLEKVIDHIKSIFVVNQTSIIAHSQGCLVTGWLSPNNIKKIILLASPVESPYQRMKEYFANRQGTTIDEQAESKIKRSDGSWTLVEADFWKDIKQIDPMTLYKDLSQKTDLYFVRALQDHVITDNNYEDLKSIPQLTYLEINGDHNFEGDDREEWLNKMVEIIES